MYNPITSLLFYPPNDVRPAGPTLQWSIDPAYNGVQPFTFTLSVSETPDFSVILYTLQSVDTFYITDTTGWHKNIGKDFYYQVTLTTATGDSYTSKTVQVGATASSRHKYLQAAFMTRGELLRSRKYTGFEAWLLKRKTFGTPTSTVDPVSGAPMTDDKEDYGTGIVGGYYSPLSFYVSREQLDMNRQFKDGGLGVEESSNVAGRCVGFPNLEAKDIVVNRATGDRYNVVSPKTRYFPGSTIPVVQTMTLLLLPPTDTIYQLTLP